MLSEHAYHLLILLLVVWATTGLTIIHLGVLGWRFAHGRLFPSRRVRTPRDGPLGGPRPDLTLTFVVPVHNDGMTIGPTIKSLLRQSVRPDRILVVNDGSTDNTAEVIDGFRAQGVDVIHLPTNVGKSRALDHALGSLTTDLVSVTDADSIVERRYVEEMLESFRDEKVAAVGGAVESIPHTWITAARQIEYMLTVNIDRNAEDTMDALVVLPGVSSTYRTKVLRELGFEFDTIAEDFDLTFRMQRAGHRIRMNLRAKVFTSDPPTLSAYYSQLMRWYTDFWLVLKKHRAVLGKRVFGTVEVPMLVLNAVVSSILYLFLPLYLLATKPSMVLGFIAFGLVFDGVIIFAGLSIYRRTDLLWAFISRVPTRIVARFAFLHAMARVLIGRPGTAWKKLDRRPTEAFLVSRAVPADVASPTATQTAAKPRADHQ